jgi:hypothetical protein
VGKSMGTNLTGVVSVPVGKTLFFATASKDGIESEPSNVVSVEVPAAPTGTRVVILQYSQLNPTNFTDIGFLRLKAP